MKCYSFSMKPCYIDLHIHTSPDANHLNNNYDVDLLLKKLSEESLENDSLISITDHNAINKDVYLSLKDKNINFIVGVELTIRNYDNCDPYHCHFYFNIGKEELSGKIDKLNTILNNLYPNKLPSKNDVTIPHIQKLVDSFDDFDFLVLPHGGQSHSTFDCSIPHDGTRFDTTMMKSLYYNVFDGFTARSNKGLEDTIKYFKKLQINDIINLVTCSDNYNPSIYPSDRNNNNDFVKTWMYSSPSFSGLRVALSESSRLSYGDKPIDVYQHLIRGATLRNEKINIDVKFSSGLNVVIGSSSSGKTLLVDSIYNKIANKSCDNYLDYKVSDIHVDNPTNISPHYFAQNYILKEIIELVKNNKGHSDIESITLLNEIFHFDEEKQRIISDSLNKLSKDITTLFDSSKAMLTAADKIKKVPSLVNLIITSDLPINPYSPFLPDSVLSTKIGYSNERFINDVEEIKRLKDYLSNISFMPKLDTEFDAIITKVSTAKKKNDIELKIRELINKYKKEIDDSNDALSSKSKKAIKDKAILIQELTNYIANYKQFYKALDNLKTFSLNQESKEIVSSDHKLSIINKLVVTPDIIVEKFKTYFGERKILSIDSIQPLLFQNDNLLSTYKNKGIEKIRESLIGDFKKENKIIYRILYKGKEDFFKLSPGLQASVILDIILGYADDNAPLIIDQPEDNLSINYINGDLIKKIKESKNRKQIIIVSHNATIPMLGDAQNIILCENEEGKINISSHFLESTYKGKSMTDWVADLTDGGKKSIKKRFKKYNIKHFTE